jgi:hypothetical protein
VSVTGLSRNEGIQRAFVVIRFRPVAFSVRAATSHFDKDGTELWFASADDCVCDCGARNCIPGPLGLLVEVMRMKGCVKMIFDVTVGRAACEARKCNTRALTLVPICAVALLEKLVDQVFTNSVRTSQGTQSP